MRVLALFVLSYLCCVTSFSQKIEKYYDQNWKECPNHNAVFYSTIEHTDTGWYRSDYYLRQKAVYMQGTFEDSSCKIPNGVFYYFHANGKLAQLGKCENGKKEGIWLQVYDNGMLEDSTVYLHDKKIGTSLGYYYNGNERDSSVTTENGEETAIEWFENGNISSAGRYVKWNIPTKTWLYYHENGQLSAREKYENGHLVSKSYFDENGQPMDTANRDSPVSYPGGIHAWAEYLQKKLYFPSQYKFEQSAQAVTVINFTVGTDGKIKDIHIEVPFHPDFDRIAYNIVKNCKTIWLPAIAHNRKIPAEERQSVIFNQK